MNKIQMKTPLVEMDGDTQDFLDGITGTVDT